MKIQVVCYQKMQGTVSGVTFNTFSEVQAFDDFDFTFINLNCLDLWQREGTAFSKQHESNFIHDFRSIREMIQRNKSLNKIVMFPGNLKIGDSTINYLKDDIKWMKDANLRYLCNHVPDFYFEKTITSVKNKNIESNFSFSSKDKMLTQSINGSKVTTVLNDTLIYTTLQLLTTDDLILFLEEIELISHEGEKEPEWIGGIQVFDDVAQLEKIQIAETEISEKRKIIESANDKLSENKRFKSILYTQSDELVDVVFEMFENMLGVDLKSFEDKKKEDIAFQIDDKVFIGEIKGITDNVKASRLAQLDNHYYHFVESHEEIQEENIYKLLIINHQRKKPLENRDPVDKNQINLAASKYGSLIVETTELLNLYEKFVNNETGREQIIEELTKTGILKV